MHIYTETPLWKDVNEILHVFTTCPSVSGKSVHFATATVVDNEKICSQCIERMKSVSDPPGIGGELII
jgi:hypothetical protein